MSLIAWLPLNENTITEKIANRTVSAAAGLDMPTYGATGKIGSGYTFSNSGIKVSNIPATAEMSFALWIKLNTNTQCHILDFRTNNNTGYQPIYYLPDSGIQIHSAISGGGGGYVSCSLNTSWHHLVVVMKKSKGTLYLDGNEAGSITNLLMFDNTIVNMHIGCRYSSENPCSGIIQDVRVYNHILSKKEIKEISKGLRFSYENKNITNLFNISQYLTNGGNNMTVSAYGYNGFILTSKGSDPYVGTALAAGGNIGSYVTFPVVAGRTYRISWRHVQGLELNKNYLTYINNNNTAVETYTAFGGAVIKSGNKREYIFTVPSTAVKVHCRFGNASLASGNSITIDNVSLIPYDNTIKSTPLYFNGTSDYIDLGPMTLDMSNITFIATVKWHALQTWSRIWDFGVSTSGAQEAFVLANNGSSSSLMVAGRLIGGAAMPDSQVGTITINKWYHIAVVVKDTQITTYISNDNKFKQQYHTFTLNGKFNDSNSVAFKNCYLGKSNWGADALFKGEIANFQIYSSSLNEEDIKTLYLTAQAIDNQGNEFIHKLDEFNTQSIISCKGEHNCNYLSEIIQLDDGSYWIQLQHHNNKSSTNLFPQHQDNTTLDFSNNFIYQNDECWAAFHLIKDDILRYNSNYEFMCIENTQNNNIIMRRWLQTVNPFNASYEDVLPSSGKFTNISNMPTSMGGMRRNDSSKAYFRLVCTGSSGWWYGAFGCWSTTGYVGIPATRYEDGTENITTGIYDLYMRINLDALKYKEFKNGIIMPTTINEI